MIQAFIAEVKKNIALAESIYGIDMSHVAIRCDIKGYRTAGQAGWKRRNGVETFSLRFHPKAIEKYYNDMVEDIVPHEVAHMVCYLKPTLGNNHNNGWKRVCRSLGGSASVKHKMSIRSDEYHKVRAVAKANTVSKKFLYHCSNGGTIELGLGRHNSLRTGKVIRYSHKTKGDIVKSGFIRRSV